MYRPSHADPEVDPGTRHPADHAARGLPGRAGSVRRPARRDNASRQESPRRCGSSVLRQRRGCPRLSPPCRAALGLIVKSSRSIAEVDAEAVTSHPATAATTWSTQRRALGEGGTTRLLHHHQSRRSYADLSPITSGEKCAARRIATGTLLKPSIGIQRPVVLFVSASSTPRTLRAISTTRRPSPRETALSAPSTGISAATPLQHTHCVGRPPHQVDCFETYD